MKWGLVGKPEGQQVKKVVAKLEEELAARHEEVVFEEALAKSLGKKGKPLDKLGADILVAVGGDGTVLLALEQSEQPVLGVNAGGVGFLTEVEPKYIASAVDRVLRKQYSVDERRRLAVWLGSERLPDAINEVTVQTAKIAKLITFRIVVNDEVVDTLRGDGLIVATSTGSTGYAMSVGGPIVHPSVEAVVIAPIAPFRLAARPIVIPYGSQVDVLVLSRKGVSGDKDAKVVIDGQHGYPLPYDTRVRIKGSENQSRFIRFDGGFFGRVRTKLIR